MPDRLRSSTTAGCANWSVPRRSATRYRRCCRGRYISPPPPVGRAASNESRNDPETMGCRPGADSSRAIDVRTQLDSRQNLRNGARVLDWLIVGGGIHGALLARVLVEEAGVALDRLRVLDPHAGALGPVSPVRRGDRARLSAIVGGASPRWRPDVPAPLRRAPGAAWRAPRHLPAALDRPVRRSLRRGDGASRPARRVGARRSPRDRARRGRRPARRDHGRRARRSPGRARGGVRRPAVVAVVGRGAARRPAPRSATCSSPGFGSKRRSRSRGRSSSGAGSRRSSSRCGWPGAAPGRSPCSPATSARVHEFDADSRWMGPLGLARVRAPRRGRGAPGGDRARAAHGVGTGRDRARAWSARSATARCGGCATRWRGRRSTGDGVELTLSSGDRVRGRRRPARHRLRPAPARRRPPGWNDRPAWARMRRLRLPGGGFEPPLGTGPLRHGSPGRARDRPRRQEHPRCAVGG